MARIRTIKPEFWDSPDTATASAVARLLFIAMWNWADDAGRGSANLKELEGFAFPNDDVRELSGGTSDNFRHVLAEVRDCFDVQFYKVRGRPFYEIPSWRKHQRNERTAKGKHPGADEGEVWDFMVSDQRRGGTSDYLRRTVSEDVQAGSEQPRTSGSGTGEQGNRGTGEVKTSCASAEPPKHDRDDSPSLIPETRRPRSGSDDDPDWVKFWDAYPRKDAKEGARRSWRSALKKTTAATLIDAAQRYRDDPNREPEFTAMPTTWLNQG
ncbi:MAG: hypothetical protein ACRD0P_06350, partial [Stackebrandtia sp.]